MPPTAGGRRPAAVIWSSLAPAPRPEPASGERHGGGHGLAVADLLGNLNRLVHGTTIAANALIERDGARS